MKTSFCFILFMLTIGAYGSGNLPLFSDALEKARTEAVDNVWRVQPGRYGAGPNGVRLEGLSNAVFDLTGVTLVSSSISGTALRLEDCQNITIRGLTVDYDPLPFTQGRVTAVDKAAGTVEFDIDTGYPDLTGEYVVRRMLLFLPDSSGWKPGAPDFYPREIEAISTRSGRFTFAAGFRDLDWVEPGDKLALNIRRNAAIQVMNKSSNIQWEDCTVHAAPGLAFLVRFTEDSGVYRNVRVVRGPTPVGATEPRLISANADALNIAYSRTGPVIENCEFAWMGDDSINLHGVTLPVLKWVDEQTYLTMRPVGGEMYDWLLRTGDTVRFLKPDTYEQITLGKVDSCVAVTESIDDWAELARTIWPSFRNQSRADFYLVRLQEPVEGVAVGDFTTIPETAAVGYRIENNYFHDHRARALRLMTEEGVVRGNRIERIMGVGISLGMEMQHWRESGYVKNILVENNTLKDVAYGANTASASSYTLGAISIFNQLEPRGKDTVFYQGSENVRIIGNRIEGSGVAGIQVAGARNVVVEGNVLERTNLLINARSGQQFGIDASEPIFVIDSENVLIADNDIRNAIERPQLVNRLLTIAPQHESAITAHLPQSAGEGFRFFRTLNERRDIGQIFTLEATAKISALYLPIRSGGAAQDSAATVTLAIHELDRGLPGKLVASRTGALMPDGSILRSGTWLEMDFEPIDLPAGRYAFVLGFAEGAATGRSVVLTLDTTATANTGLFSTDAQGKTFRTGKPVAFILAQETLKPAPLAARVLKVDARGGAEFSSLEEAALQARAGDTIEIAPGSGPYRQVLYIRASGTEQQPIIVEGNGELVTGFEPLTGFVKEGERWVTELGERFPAVLTYNGERILQNNADGQFSRYATIEPKHNNRLVLNPGVEPEGWEISTRYFVVRIDNTSWHTYRNLSASGAQNDGFNLHGAGTGLVFENIEAFHNLDEGYSAHDRIDSTINGGQFWGNDNGLFNIGQSKLSGGNIVCRDNLGWGLAFNECDANLAQVRVYGNGASELRLAGGANVTIRGLELTAADHKQPPYVRYKESRNQTGYIAENIARDVFFQRN